MYLEVQTRFNSINNIVINPMEDEPTSYFCYHGNRNIMSAFISPLIQETIH